MRSRLRYLLLAASPLACAFAVAAAPDAEERAAILAPTDDFSAAEMWESLSGGTATNRKRFDRDAFSMPSATLSFAERGEFFVGNGLFRRNWVVAPASTDSADGLGPLYNARSCQRCHLKDGRGHPPSGPDDSTVSMLLRLSVPPSDGRERRRLASFAAATIPEPVYGGQLQDLSVPGLSAEGRLEIVYRETPVTFADGTKAFLRAPRYRIADPRYGPLHPDTMVSPRVAPPMIGLGLLEAIAEEDIAARADPFDGDGDGISGRVNRAWSPAGQRLAVGRFGWKAGTATVADQAAAAMSGDIGVSNPLAPHPWGDCTAAQTACIGAVHGDSARHEGFEASAEIMDAIVFYSRHLAVPARRDADSPVVLAGKALFYDIGCTACHTPKHATRRDWPETGLAGQLIWPYTDLLLHDMGEGLADGSPEGAASGREWRTAPLWGIGLTETVNGHTFFLHDGRARNLTEAVLWHGGEAAGAREAFRTLPANDRAALLAFLNSL